MHPFAHVPSSLDLAPPQQWVPQGTTVCIFYVPSKLHIWGRILEGDSPNFIPLGHPDDVYPGTPLQGHPLKVRVSFVHEVHLPGY